MKSSILQNSKKTSGTQKSNNSSSPTTQLQDKRKLAQDQQHLFHLANTGKTAVQLEAFGQLLNGNAPLQKMSLEEEEPLQGKFETIQQQGLEEEEPLQGKFKTIQKMGLEEEEPLQGKFETIQQQGLEEEEPLQGKFETIQRQKNKTGLPDNLKSGIENLSGYSMDDVKVHYNSDKPATLQAHAYAQGNDIHIASGQEKHLPHEAWHVVQQKQGRVKPTIQLQGKVNVNDDAGLEKEADVMGGRASKISSENVQKRKVKATEIKNFKYQNIQRKIGFDDDISTKRIKNIRSSKGGSQGVLFLDDGGNPPIILKPEVGTANDAIDASNFTNAIIGEKQELGWSVKAPKARLATASEINHIIAVINNPTGPLKGNIPNRVQTILGKLQTNPNEIVIYENAGGHDFLDYLATGPENNDLGKKQTKKGVNSRKGSAFSQLENSGYCKQLGNAAAIDIFLGNNDRLYGKGNLENWRSDTKNKSISLVDNIITKDQNYWKAQIDVVDLASEKYQDIADRIANELVDLIQDQGFGGGKLRDKDQNRLNQIKTTILIPNLIIGLQSGRLLLMQKGWGQVLKMGATNPNYTLFKERLEFIDAG